MRLPWLTCMLIPATLSSQPVAAIPEGGKEAIEQVLETQLTLPREILQRHWTHTTRLEFQVDSSQSAVSIHVEPAELEPECKRMLRFLKFTSEGASDSHQYVDFHFSTESYSRYIKQKLKLRIQERLPADSTMTVHCKAEKAPEFCRNGDEGLIAYLTDEMYYPQVARDKSIEGTVQLEFIVETNGFVTGIQPKKAVGGGCTEEAVRLIRHTRWQPAELAGRRVRYKMSYPVTFSLRQLTRDNSFAPGGVGN
jgi:TonB family protein